MNKRGFTLIELLAVIIILGILMIIAIPSVTKYINDSRKSAYVDTAKEIVGGTRNIVNNGKLGMYDTGTTYYIPASYIETENASKSPYGEFTEAYVGVIYDGQGYKYYWISVDDAGEGVKNITLADKLDTDDIVSDLKDSDITNVIETTGIGGRKTIKILNPETGEWRETVEPASSNVSENGGKAKSLNVVCVPATTLHTKTCEKTTSSGCGLSIGTGNTITYGTLVNGNPKPGDAYDCKIMQNGDYTERFYYVTSYGSGDDEEAILIYYNDLNNGNTYAYENYYKATSLGLNCRNAYGCNHFGPLVAYQYLPSISEWNNPKLIAPGTRNIKNENGTGTVSNGSVNISEFTYTDKAARFLTYQEVQTSCNKTNITSFDTILDCNWLLENVKKYEMESGAFGGYWLETPRYASTSGVWVVSGGNVESSEAYNRYFFTIRPVITIKKDDLGD